MGIDTIIMEYLHEYGNTKESDLISYVTREFDYSDRQIKHILGRMEKTENIFRVVHDKLKPPGVYIGLNQKAEALFLNSEILPKTLKAFDEQFAKRIEERYKTRFEKKG
jgi:predicted methyltransferase